LEMTMMCARNLYTIIQTIKPIPSILVAYTVKWIVLILEILPEVLDYIQINILSTVLEACKCLPTWSLENLVIPAKNLSYIIFDQIKSILSVFAAYTKEWIVCIQMQSPEVLDYIKTNMMPTMLKRCRCYLTWSLENIIIPASQLFYIIFKQAKSVPITLSTYVPVVFAVCQEWLSEVLYDMKTTAVPELLEKGKCFLTWSLDIMITLVALLFVLLQQTKSIVIVVAPYLIIIVTHIMFWIAALILSWWLLIVKIIEWLWSLRQKDHHSETD